MKIPNKTKSRKSSFESKYPFLLSFYKDLNTFNNLIPQKGCVKYKKLAVHNNSSKLYSEYLEIYYYQYIAASDARKKLGNKYDPKNLFLEGYGYGVWLEELTDKEKLTNAEESTDIPPLPLREGDEVVVKKEKGLKILTPNKSLTRLLILLAQIKAGNNSYKLKNEIKQTLYLLHQHDNIMKTIFMKIENIKTNESKSVLNLSTCSSKLIHLLHMEKCEKTLQYSFKCNKLKNTV